MADDGEEGEVNWNQILLQWFICIATAALIGSIIYAVYDSNQRSWAQTEACSAKGGVMIMGAVDGCVRISTISQ